MSENIQLAIRYFESVMGCQIDTLIPVPVSGQKLVEVLWPLNDVFRPYMSRIKTIKYDAKYETSADEAIEKFAKNPIPQTWDKLSGQTWRVLLERHTQLLIVGMANDKAGNPSVTSLPLGLPNSACLPGIMLLLLHSMKLPWPSADRSNFEFPEGNHPVTLQLH